MTLHAALLFGSIVVLGLAVRFTRVSDTQTVLSDNPYSSFHKTCQDIAEAVSGSSAVFYDGSPEYKKDISHWAASSTQYSACSFEPGTVEDVGMALRILGRTRTPFAIKGGGHAINPGFSSSPGVQMAMSRFSDVVYDSTTETVTFGAGLVWDDVYGALEPYGRGVAGGRMIGVGVAGYILGGGYSWLTNQHGLAIDTVQAFELVIPNGTAINVTESSSPELFFALKGGGNNFGVVTRFTLKTFPQTDVWGGLMHYPASSLDRVNQATVNFAANNEDPMAQIMMMYNYNEQPFGLLLLFYNAPKQPAEVFDEFLAIPGESTVAVQSLLSLLKLVSGWITDGARVIGDGVSTPSISLPLLEAVVNQSKYWGERPNGTIPIQYAVQPFLPTLFEHNTTPSAYPPDRTRPVYPLYLCAGWGSPEDDEIAQDTIRSSTRVLRDLITGLDLESGGQGTPGAIYPNYALFDTPLADMFGSHLPRLQAIHANVDPENVMGLAGGFKF